MDYSLEYAIELLKEKNAEQDEYYEKLREMDRQREPILNHWIKVKNERLELQYYIRNHPDRIGNAANTQYEFERETEVSNE